MKLTKSKLKEIIKEELLKEYIDLNDPIDKIKKLTRDFRDDLNYYAGGETDGDSIEYEGPDGHSKYTKRHKALVKWQKNTEKVIKKVLDDYTKAWKVK